LEVTTQEENDLLSELLLHSQYSNGVLGQVWTGGKARNSGQRSASYYWDGSTTIMNCKLLIYVYDIVIHQVYQEIVLKYLESNFFDLFRHQ
jgi:hypothetical protein